MLTIAMRGHFLHSSFSLSTLLLADSAQAQSTDKKAIKGDYVTGLCGATQKRSLSR